MLQTIRMPNNIHYLTDRLPKANYLDIVASFQANEGTKIQAERTMPVMSDNEVLDSQERSKFLAEIKKKGRLRNGPGISKEHY